MHPPSHCYLYAKHLRLNLLLIAIMATLCACASRPSHAEFYNASGQPSHSVHCLVGAYESCLQQMSDLCHEQGYTIEEKIRQTKLGSWVDNDPEILLVAQCKNSPKALSEQAGSVDLTEAPRK